MESFSKKDKELAKKITAVRCNAWLANPLINPITGAEINYKGPTYNIFETVCKEKFNIEADEHAAGPSETAAPPNTSLPKLPKDIDGIAVPKNRKEWGKNKLINRDFHKILLLITNSKVRYISEYILENLPSYVKLCEIGLMYNLVPENDIEQIRTYHDRFTYYSTRENLNGVNKIKKESIDTIESLMKHHGVDLDRDNTYTYPLRFLRVLEMKEEELYRRSKELQEQILYSGLNDSLYQEGIKIANLIGAIIYYKLIYNDTDALVANWNSTTNPLTHTEVYQKLARQFKELFTFINELKDLDARRNIDIKSITSNSKSATLPSSISQNRVVQRRRVPKELIAVETSEGETIYRQAPGPDVFEEFSMYVNEASTGRSTFKRHSILSNMKPLSRESLEALPEKKRVQLLKELKSQCNEMKDSITGKRFDRMSKKNLHLIVQLGPNAAPKVGSDGNTIIPHPNKRCYYVRNIYKFWESVAKNNSAFKDPVTRIGVTDVEKADIMRKVRYIKHNALDPELQTIKKDPKLEMVILLDPTGRFYTFSIKRRIGSWIYTIYDLGVVPANIDLTHAEGGAAYYSSEATVANIKDLFDKGRIMESNFIPYTCCKMHFKKENYWSGSEAEVHRKFKLFADEVYGLM